MIAMSMLFPVFGEATLVPGRIRVLAAVRRSPPLRTVQVVGRTDVLNWPRAVEPDTLRCLAAADGLRLRSRGALR